LLLGLANIGAALEEVGGEPRRALLRERLVVQRGATRDVGRTPSEQEAEEVLLRDDLPLQIGDAGGRRGQRGLGARGLEGRGGPRLETAAEESMGLLERRRGPPGDLELKVQLSQPEV